MIQQNKQIIPGKCRFHRCTRKTKRKRGSICQTHNKMIWRIKYPMKAAFQTLRQNVRRRNKHRPQAEKIPFDLTFEDFKAFCTKTKYMRGKGRTADCYSIDRINDDPKKGYFGYRLDNIQKLRVPENSRKYHLRAEYDEHEKKLIVTVYNSQKKKYYGPFIK